MAEIRAFKRLRFTDKAGDISELVCPPYDIIDEEQREEFLRTNSHNVIRLELPKGENPYKEAAATLEDWIQDGILACDGSPSLYIYEEDFVADGKEKKICGIIGRVRLHEFSEGIILPHENTLSKAKEDRFSLMKSTFCNFSQIYSLYNDRGGVTAKTLGQITASKPETEFTASDGVVQKLWRVTDEKLIESLEKQFEDRRLFIADGHHRYETALRFKKFCAENKIACEDGAENYCMMMLVAMESDGLVVFPTHRIVKNLKGFSREAFLESANENFYTQAISRGEINERMRRQYEKGEKSFVLCTEGEKFDLLTLKSIDSVKRALPEECDAIVNLDVTVLHTMLLEKVLGIDRESMASGINLEYTRDEDEAVRAAQDGRADCSFIINPTRVSEIRDVAAAGGKMPQKSTYFWPKLITGLVMNKLK